MSINLNQSVFTTKHIVEHNSPITNVIHDHEGDWQFFGSEEISEVDARIISLNQIINIDPTIKAVLNLPIGMEAYRNNIDEDFKIRKY